MNAAIGYGKLQVIGHPKPLRLLERCLSALIILKIQQLQADKGYGGVSRVSRKDKKEDTGKVQWVEVKTDGEIQSAFPDDEENSLSQLGREPMEMSDLEEMGSFREEASRAVTDQIDAMQSEVKDISKLSVRQALDSKQVATLKKYIELKELEVRDLKEQRTQYQNIIKKLNFKSGRLEEARESLTKDLESYRMQVESMQSELVESRVNHREELDRVRNEYDQKMMTSGDFESRIKSMKMERDQWKEKIKEDLKKIRLKERELENKYELLKRDSNALLDSKDQHVLELKKKTDRLELDMEALEERFRNLNSHLGQIENKKLKLIETLKLAITLLEEIDTVEDVEPSPQESHAPELAAEASAVEGEVPLSELTDGEQSEGEVSGDEGEAAAEQNGFDEDIPPFGVPDSDANDNNA